MSETILVALISCICSYMPNKDAKLACFDYHTNCAVVEGGKILTKEEFSGKCAILPRQTKACMK